MGPSRRHLHPDLGLRISLCVAGLLAGLTVSVSVLVIQVQRAQLLRSLADRGRAVVALAAGSARLAVFTENREDLRRALATVLAEADVIDACAFDEGGHLLTRVARAADSEATCGVNGGPLPWAPPAADQGHRQSPGAFTFWGPVRAAAPLGSEEALYFRAADPGEVVRVTTGHVTVRLSDAGLREGMRQVLGRSVGVGVVFLVLGIALGHGIVRSVTRPLRELAASVRARGVPAGGPPGEPEEGGAGDRTKGGKDEARDEVGLLAETYSGLLEALDRTFADLQALRDALEEKVAARTVELREARDRLEEKVAERTAELEQTYRQLLHAEKLSEAGRIAASVAHEFNNPVFGIRGALQELTRHPGLGPGDRDLARAAIAECDRLARLVRDLQQFSRPTSARPERLDLRQLVETMLVLCSKEFRRKRIAVETRFGDDVPPMLAVEDQIKQVVLNLLTNAGDAVGDGGGTIRIATERRGEEVALRVEDTGRGIPPEVRAHIFEPFFTTKPAVKGTGLGLSVSYGIVRRHGGRLEAESPPGSGAVFTMILPIEGTREP